MSKNQQKMAEEKKVKFFASVRKLSADVDLDHDREFRTAVHAEMRLCKGGLYGVIGSQAEDELYLKDLPKKLKKTNSTNYLNGTRSLIMYFMSSASDLSPKTIEGMVVAIYPSVEHLIPRHGQQVKSKNFLTEPHLKFPEQDTRKNKMMDILAVCAVKGMGTKLWNHFVRYLHSGAADLPTQIKDADFTADVRGGRTDLKRGLNWRGDNKYPITKLHTQEEPLKSHNLPPPSEPKLLKVFTDFGFHESVPYAQKGDGNKYVWVSGENKIPLFVYGNNEDILKKAGGVAEKKRTGKLKKLTKTVILPLIQAKRRTAELARMKAQEAAKKAAEAAEQARLAKEQAAMGMADQAAVDEARRKAEQAKKDAEKAKEAADRAAKEAKEAEARKKQQEIETAKKAAEKEAADRKKLELDEKHKQKQSPQKSPTRPQSPQSPQSPRTPSSSPRSLSKSPTPPSSPEEITSDDEEEQKKVTPIVIKRYRVMAWTEMKRQPEAQLRRVLAVVNDQLDVESLSEHERLIYHNVLGRANHKKLQQLRTYIAELNRASQGGKRHPKVLRDKLQGITKNDIRRLARRGGVKRIKGTIYQDTRLALKAFLERILRHAVTYTEHAHRKTVTAMDVVYALKRDGRPIYGFGG